MTDLIQAVVIAPFWDHVNTQFGSIYYRLSTYYDIDFTKLQQILTTAFSLEDFEITQILVATYDRVEAYSSNEVSLT